MVNKYANLALAAVIFAGISGGLASATPCTATNGECTTTASSLPATVTGTLPNQGTALLINFSLSSPSDLTAWTTSYAGGMNLDGTTTMAGGFQPNLILYDSTGAFVTGDTGTAPPNANTDPNTGLYGDAYLTNSSTPAGSYTMAVTSFWLNQSTTATNLSDGFTQNLGNGTTFNDVQFNPRNGNYAVNISATPLSSTGPGGPTSAVPEPATVFLLLPAFALALLLRKRIAKAVQ